MFAHWMRGLRDRKAQAAIAKRIIRMRNGLFGDVKPVGEGVMEARVHIGPGYRLYYVQQGSELILLLCGGDKSGQERDIATAKRLAATLERIPIRLHRRHCERSEAIHVGASTVLSESPSIAAGLDGFAALAMTGPRFIQVGQCSRSPGGLK